MSGSRFNWTKPHREEMAQSRFVSNDLGGLFELKVEL